MMSNMSFIDKLKILTDVISSSGIFIVFILLFIVLGFLFITTNKSNSKSSRRVYILMYIAIILFLIITYKESLQEMFDYMMNNFFIVVYFPNLAVYLAAIIATNIIVWVSIFNFKINKLIKTINVVVFCLIHYLLILILNIITEKGLDVFTQTSVYGNKQALALIELSSTLFIIWIIFLVLYKLIRKFIGSEKEILIDKNQAEINNKILNNINKIDAPYVLKNTQIKNNSQNRNVFDNLLTIDDYKLLLNILKEKKLQQEQEELEKQELNNQSKFMELQALYKSIDS